MLFSTIFGPLLALALALATPAFAGKSFMDPETGKCRGRYYHGETRCWNDEKIQYCENGRWNKKDVVKCPKYSVCRRPKPNEWTQWPDVRCVPKKSQPDPKPKEMPHSWDRKRGFGYQGIELVETAAVVETAAAVQTAAVVNPVGNLVPVVET